MTGDSATWLLASDDEPDDRFQFGDVVYFADEKWTAAFGSYQLLNGTSAFPVEATIHKDFELTAKRHETLGQLSSNLLVEGEYGLNLPGESEYWLTSREGAMFALTEGQTRSRLLAGQTIRIFSYNSPVEILERYLEDDAPRAVRKLVIPTPPQSNLTGFPMTQPMRRLVFSALRSEYQGALLHLQMEGIVSQLLAHQLHAMARGESLDADSSDLSFGEAQRIERAREILLTDLRAPPTLCELAQEAGMSERRLSRGFKKRYGATVYEVLRIERMKIAWEILQTEDVPLKQIAHRIGYRHVTNFINAFTKQFGKPPRKMSQDLDRIIHRG